MMMSASHTGESETKMFTGLVEEIGTVNNISLQGTSGTLAVKASVVTGGTKIGDSIAVNGVCLTVTSLTDDGFTADVMAETVRRSCLGKLKSGDRCNLERAMAADGRFGGHIVSGHIDGTGRISAVVREENAIWFTIETDKSLLAYIVEKGSVALDGISLTVAAVSNTDFKVSIIPHTQEATTLYLRKPGDIINIETDVIGKYVAKMMGLRSTADATENDDMTGENKGGITLEFLRDNGF